MKKASLKLVLAGISIGALVGCSSNSGVTTSTANTGDVPQILQLAVKNDYTTTQPVGGWFNQSLQSNLMFRTLLVSEADLRSVKPDLASGYEVSDDHLTYTINLIEGNRWSDGEYVTPEDVKFSIEYNLLVTVSNQLYQNAFGNIVGATEWKNGTADEVSGITIDGNDIIIQLENPYSAFIPVLAQFDIIPKHAVENIDPDGFHNSEFWLNPVTNGMFMVDEVSVGSFYTLVPNPYSTETKPIIEKVVINWVPDYVTAVQNDQAYYYHTSSIDEMKILDSMSNMGSYMVDAMFYRYFVVNMQGIDGNQNPAMQDYRVRQAFMHAIDRDAIDIGVLNNMASVINSGVSEEHPANDGFVYEYDPVKARELLEEADFDFDYTVRLLTYYTDQTAENFMNAVAAYLGQIGVKTELIFTTQGGLDLFTTRNYDLGYKGLSAFSIEEWYYEYLSTNEYFQHTIGGDTVFDDLVKQLEIEVNIEKREDILRQLQQIEHDTLYKLPVFTLDQVIFINEGKLQIPDDIEFGNPFYECDIKFEEWRIIN
ncbi:MAG: hypothetical protein ATN35_10795 [Epulopiscium sp. Nele67-Bin004]|nr:MAG: hypothetical protein ATN35_10795 [Epulopiscium sp. Nele67-Bin004]